MWQVSMKARLRLIIRLCVLMLFIFTANAIGVGADPQDGELLLSKAETISAKVSTGELSPKTSKLILNKGAKEPVAVSAKADQQRVNPNNGPGPGAMLFFAFALVILISSRQRRI